MSSESTVRSKHVHHVAYATRDPEATYDFYANKLGMKLLRTENHRQGDGYFRHFFFDMGNGECLAFARIAPDGMIRFFERLSEKDKERVELFSSHPMSAARAGRLKAELAALPKQTPEPFTFEWKGVQDSLGASEPKK